MTELLRKAATDHRFGDEYDAARFYNTRPIEFDFLPTLYLASFAPGS